MPTEKYIYKPEGGYKKVKQGLCINLEGWDGEGDGSEAQEGEDICISMADSC